MEDSLSEQVALVGVVLELALSGGVFMGVRHALFCAGAQFI